MPVDERDFLAVEKFIIPVRRAIWDIERRGHFMSENDKRELAKLRRELRRLKREQKGLIAAAQLRLL